MDYNKVFVHDLEMHRTEFSISLILCILAFFTPNGSAVPITQSKAILTGKEYIYDYKTYVAAGSLELASQSSMFAITGNLHIQGAADNNVAIQLQNIKLGTYNGDFNHKNYPNIKFVEHADLTASLSLPFLVNYDSHRQVESMIVSADEENWVTNIKKATASFLQIHLDEIAAGKKAFTVKERTIHGSCPTAYEVTPCHVHPENTIVVRKYRRNKNCQNRQFRFQNPLNLEACPGENDDEPFHSTTYQTYHIVRGKDGQTTVQSVEVLGRIQHRMFGNNGLNHYSFFNQTVILKSIQDIASPLDVSRNTKSISDLTYQFDNDDINPQTILNLKVHEPLTHFNLDHQILKAKLVDYLVQFLQRTVDTLEESHVYRDINRVHDSALSQSLLVIFLMDYEHWEAAYERVNAGTTARDKAVREFFLDLLPTAGTSPAALFLLQLLKNSPNDRARLVRGLAILPFHLRYPTESLVEEFAVNKNLITTEDDPINFRTIRLSFSNLVGVTCQRRCSEAFLDKYINLFYEQFSGANSESDQLLYLSMLNNVGTGKVAELLLPIVKGEKKYSKSVRISAMWVVQHVKDKALFIDTFMGIFFNRLEDYEIRITAFDVIVKHKPTFDQMLQISASLCREPSRQVSHYVFTTYKSLSLTTHPCDGRISKAAKFLVRYMCHTKTRGFNPLLSGSYTLDYIDKQFNFGHQTSISLVASHDSAIPRSVSWHYNAYFAGLNTDYLAVYIRQEGISDAIYRQILDPKTLHQDELKSILEKLHVKPRIGDHMQLEIEVSFDRYVLFHVFLDEKSFESVSNKFRYIQSLEREYKLNHHRCTAFSTGQYEEPTDFGTPFSTANVYSSELAFKGAFKHDMSEATLTIHSNVDIHTRQHYAAYLINYNPITGVMHRVHHANVFVLNAPHDVELGLDFAQQQLKLSTVIPDQSDPLEIVIHARGKVDIKSLQANEFLKESCENCKSSVDVSQGSDSRKSITLINYDSKLGDHWRVKIFDCERKDSYGQFLNTVKGFFNPATKSASETSYGSVTLGINNLLDYMVYAPTGYTCGIYLTRTGIQDEKNRVSRVEGLFRLKVHDEEDEVDFFAGKKYYSRASLTIKGVPGKSDDRKVEASIVYRYNRFHQNVEFKFKLVRGGNPEKNINDYVICLDYKKNYPDVVEDILSLEEKDVLYEAQSDISALWGESEGGKCPVNKAAVRTNIHFRRSEKQKALLKEDVWPYNQCARDKENRTDWAGNVWPITPACIQASVEQTTPLETELHIQYTNIPQALQTMYDRLLAVTKIALYPYWNNDGSEDSGSSSNQHDITPISPGEIQIIRELSVDHVLADIHIHSQKERNHFKNVDYRLLPFDPFTKNVRFLGALLFAREHGILGSCSVSPSVVTTLDNATYHTSISECDTLVSSDCSENPKYAMFLKRMPNKRLGLKLMTSGHKLEITDRLLVDGAAVEASGKPYSYPEDESHKYFQVMQRNQVYDIYLPLYNILVYHAGDYATIFLPPTFRSNHCGLCGNYDGEISNEFVAPEKCYMKDGADMAKAYAVRDSSCDVFAYTPCT